MRFRLLVVAALATALPIQERKREGILAQLFGLGSTSVAAVTIPAATIATVAPTTAAVAAAAVTTAQTAPAAVAPAAATSAATPAANSAAPSKGFLASFWDIFDNGGGSSSAAAVASPTPASSTPVAATPAAATPAASSSGSGWFSNLFLNLFGSSSSGTTATPPATATPATGGTSSSAAFSPNPAVSNSAVSANPVSPSPVSLASLAMTSASSSSLNILNLFLSASQSLESPGFSGLVEVGGTGSGDTGSESSGTANIALNSEIAQVAGYSEKGAGITYSPYTKSGGCKSASQVAQDIKALLAYSMIRLYSVDCSGIQNVVSAMSSLQKLFLGVWDVDNLNTDLPSMQTQVLSGSRGWLAVHTVAIGNELVNAGTKTVAQVKAAVSNARSWFKSNASGYSGYIVSVDTLAAVMADSSMCDISDYLAVNCHPYFSGIEALTSGTWLKSQVASLQSHCNNGKLILITESGWPTYGNTVGQAVPSQDNQLLAVKGLANVMGSQVIMFTTYNDYWKAPGPYNVEQHWGIYGDPSA